MQQKVLFITGATGFLGSYLTRELVGTGCRLILLIRKGYGVQAKDRLYEVFPLSKTEKYRHKISFDNIEVAEGDVALCNFGLETNEYIRLSEIVDEVFHCAAATKFNNDASDVHTRTNIFGSTYISEFCKTGKVKRLHYISTAYIAGKRRGTVMEDELDAGQQFNNSYERTKCEAEKFLVTYAGMHSLPYTVYRPSIIVGDVVEGSTVSYDNLYLFAKGLRHINKFGKREDKKEKEKGNKKSDKTDVTILLRIPGDKYSTINLTPVDYVARAIIAISKMEKSTNRTFHIVNPSPPTLDELTEWMKVATGNYRLRIVSMNDFQKYPQTVQEKYLMQKTRAFLPYMFGEPYFDTTNTREFLRGTGIECPLITQELINRYVNYAIKTDWGKKVADYIGKTGNGGHREYTMKVIKNG